MDKVSGSTDLQESKATIKTRRATQLFGLGTAICKDDATITGCRLPTCLQVLRCMMYHCNEAVHSRRPGSVGSTSRFTTAKLVLHQVITFYNKANIPMVTERRACEKIVKLLDDNNKLRAIDKSRRSTPATLRRLEDMQQRLASTFELWPPNVESLIQNQEDLAFLQSMKGDRSASFGSFDKKLKQKISMRISRQDAETKRLNHARELMAATSSTAQYAAVEEGVDSEDSATEESSLSDQEGTSAAAVESQAKKTPHRKKWCGTRALIPPDLLSRPDIVSLATRLKITPAQQAAFTQGVIVESGGDLSQVATSYATADRARRKVVSEIATKIRDDWTPPKLCTLHWDSKLTPTLTNHRLTEERLTVLVGNAKQTKLLGVPRYKKETNQSAGKIIADLTMKLMVEWHCTDNIVNMTFDTTSSNTGHLTAACIAIQDVLQRPLLWSGCRHHVGEVVLSHVFENLKIEASKSPDISLFTRLRSNWHLLPHSAKEAHPFCPDHHSPEAQEVLRIMKAEMVECATNVAEFQRDDYREFSELSMVYLNASDGEVSFRRPGALHKARWLAKLLYCLKIALSENHIAELPRGTITTCQQVSKVRAFATFITHVYGVWWLTCMKSVDAPWNDLQLYKRLLQYEIVNKIIAQSAVRAMKRHFWYLTSEMVPLALFSEKVPPLERQALADALIDVKPLDELHAPQNRFGAGWGKPRFPAITASTRLSDLVEVDSWFTIYHLEIDGNFLQLPVAEWGTSAAYITSSENVASVNVINDAAERGVKLSSGFVDTARSDDHFQNVLQVVEKDRKTIKNLRKLRKRKHQDDLV